MTLLTPKTSKTLKPLLVFLTLLYINTPGVGANWLLQCSTCVDQTFYSDKLLKENVTAADTGALLDKIKRIQVQEYVHRTDEYFGTKYVQIYCSFDH